MSDDVSAPVPPELAPSSCRNPGKAPPLSWLPRPPAVMAVMSACHSTQRRKLGIKIPRILTSGLNISVPLGLCEVFPRLCGSADSDQLLHNLFGECYRMCPMHLIRECRAWNCSMEGSLPCVGCKKLMNWDGKTPQARNNCNSWAAHLIRTCSSRATR